MENNHKISIGLINFLNCLPINYTLEKWSPENIVLSWGHPALINQLINAGQVHLAPFSSIEYLKNQNNYVLIKNACITSDAECGSVILFSNYKFEDLSGKNIAIPHNSATSIAMLKVLLKERGVKLESVNFSIHKYECTVDAFLSPHSSLHYDAVLQIGDAALISRFKYENSLPDFYSYDLGKVWKEVTGLSPVFGTWAARADWAITHQDDFKKINLLISKAVETGLGVYFNEVTKEAASNLELPEDYVKDYLTAKIKYNFTDEQEKSLQLFKKMYLSLDQ